MSLVKTIANSVFGKEKVTSTSTYYNDKWLPSCPSLPSSYAALCTSHPALCADDSSKEQQRSYDVLQTEKFCHPMFAAWSNKFATKNLVSHLGSKRYTGCNRASFRTGKGKQNKTRFWRLTRLLAATTFLWVECCIWNLGIREMLFSSLFHDLHDHLSLGNSPCDSFH